MSKNRTAVHLHHAANAKPPVADDLLFDRDNNSACQVIKENTFQLKKINS